MNYDIEREWFERRASQEADLEIGAGRRLTQTIHLTPEEITVLEKLVNPTAAALRTEIAALKAENATLRKLATHASNCGHRFGHDCDCPLSSLSKSKESGNAR